MNRRFPLPLLFCCTFIARGWFITLIEFTAQNQKIALIELFYPQQKGYLLSLLLGVPALLTLLLNRYPGQQGNRLCSIGKPLLLLSLIGDLALQLLAIKAHPFIYSLPKAVLLTITIWLLLWVVRTNSLNKDHLFNDHLH